jgi:hypothetical protein
VQVSAVVAPRRHALEHRGSFLAHIGHAHPD